MTDYESKCARLHELLAEYTKESAAVAFSGGADSSLLLKLAVLHARENGTGIYAVTVRTELHPAADMKRATEIATEIGADHLIMDVDELRDAGIKNNPENRCYLCKRHLFQSILDISSRKKVFRVMEGTNADDLLSYRPGIRALEELGIISPLKEAGFTKQEVRRMAGEYGISAANQPASPCLATRFPYGTRLTREKLECVEKGEAYLKTLGFYNIRLRVHDDIARIEADDKDIGLLVANRREITGYLRRLGYRYITADLMGFRSGSMDEELEV